MTATAHALVGGAIAASTQNPALGIALSFASHPILDMIPHWDLGWGWRKKNKLTFFFESSFDLILGVILAYIFFGRSVGLWYFFACILASESWDILMMPRLLFNWKFPPFSTFYNMQSKIQGKTKTMLGGILTQVGAVVVILLVLRIAQF